MICTRAKSISLNAFIRLFRRNKMYILIFLLGVLTSNIFSICVFTINDSIDYVLFDPKQHNSKDEYHKNKTNSTAAKILYEKVKVLCWVLTVPKNTWWKARHVKSTWGRRCNYLIFMSHEPNRFLPAISIPIKEGKKYLWGKTKLSLKYLYDNYLNSYDWFLKADDDSYVILENLRYMLLDKNPENPIYFGCHFKKHVKQGYMSGGAGYVLSRQALKQFIENGLKKTTHCHPGLKGDEDVELGRCLEAAQVKVGDSRDSQKRGRYFGVHPKEILTQPYLVDGWYKEYLFHRFRQGMEGISDYAVSFHHVEVVDMYFFEYLIYHLRPFGIYDIPQNVSYYLN